MFYFCSTIIRLTEQKMEKQFAKNIDYRRLFTWSILIAAILLNNNILYGKNKQSKSLETVVIDAGHGGKDPGTMTGKMREKDITLAIALNLGNLIKEKIPGVKVIYTRHTDVFIPLFERSVIANKINADLFISIHVNFCATPAIKGTETYVLGLHRTEDNLNVAKKENSAILLEQDYSTRYEGFNPNLSESYIMFELIQDTNIEQSVEFAGIIQDSFRKHAQRDSRDVRQAGFLVLRESAMPSVLIETGYLSNPSEAAYLMSDNGRMSIATSIFNSFKTYKNKFESRLNKTITTSLDANDRANKPVENVVKKELEVKTKELPKVQETTEPTIKKSNKSLVKEKSSSTDGISYAVQIAAFPQKLPLNSKIFKGIKDVSEFQFGGYYKYYCLSTTTLSESKHNLLQIQLKIPKAFIIVFKNGEPIQFKDIPKSK
jgi:N-acetylmuramoyl-L-alanine amidase